MQSEKVMVVDHLTKKEFTATDTTPVDYPLAEMRDIGAFLDDIQVVLYGEKWDALNVTISGETSFDGVQWESFSTSIITQHTFTAAAPLKISSPYSTRTDFGPHIRLVVTVACSSGTNQSGTLSLEARYRFAS